MADAEAFTRCKCGHLSNTLYNLKEHIGADHLPEFTPYHCDLCEFKSVTVESVVLHFRKKHRESEKLQYSYKLQEVSALNFFEEMLKSSLQTSWNTDTDSLNRNGRSAADDNDVTIISNRITEKSKNAQETTPTSTKTPSADLIVLIPNSQAAVCSEVQSTPSSFEQITCPLCQFAFKPSKGLKRTISGHVMCQHLPPEKNLLKCGLCDGMSKARTVVEVRQHILSKHLKEVKESGKDEMEFAIDGRSEENKQEAYNLCCKLFPTVFGQKRPQKRQKLHNNEMIH